MLKLNGFQLKNKRVELTWIYVDAKCVPAATLRRRLNSNWWVALCDLNWDTMGSIQSVMGTMSQIRQSYVNRRGKRADKGELGSLGDLVTGILTKNQCAPHNVWRQKKQQ